MSDHARLNSPSQAASSQASVNEADCELASLDYGSEMFSSDVTEQDEMEAFEDAFEELLNLEPNFDLGFNSPEVVSEGVEGTVLSSGQHLYAVENMNQPCDCTCHHWDFNEEQIGPQVEEELTMLERWLSQNASDTMSISLWPNRDNFLPCQVCICYNMMEEDIDLNVDSSDQEEE
jgi:hypothetical protein